MFPIYVTVEIYRWRLSIVKHFLEELCFLFSFSRKSSQIRKGTTTDAEDNLVEQRLNYDRGALEQNVTMLRVKK